MKEWYDHVSVQHFFFSIVCETKYNSLFLKDQRISWLLFFSSNQMQLFSLYAFFWVTLRLLILCYFVSFYQKQNISWGKKHANTKETLRLFCKSFHQNWKVASTMCVIHPQHVFTFSIFCKMFYAKAWIFPMFFD